MQKRPRKPKRTVMYEGDVEAADAVTFQTVTRTNRAGKQSTKKIKIAINAQCSQATETPPAGPSQEIDGNNFNDVEMPDDMPIIASKPRKVRLHKYCGHKNHSHWK